jgi:tetratricopeptide (TPR) repeat protein
MPKPQAHQLTAWLVFLLILGGFLTLVIWFPFAYVWATYEDLYGEWVQWYQYAAVLLLSGWLALRPSPYRWFYLALALASFYTAGEEISWGQRLLGFGSPEFFDEYNLQEETNLHNFLTGPEATWTNDLMQYTLATALLGYGLVYPLLLRFGWGLATWVRRVGIPAPPLELWPFFATAALFELGQFHFNEAEIAEILVGTAMMFMLAGHVYRYRAQPGSVDGGLDARQSRALATALALLVVGVAVLAITTTQLIYRDPVQRTAIDQRVLNGFEKFGNRYAELELWPRAADFYARSYAGQPARTDLLEKLVTSLQTAGDDPQYRKYARELMERTLTAEQRSSRNVAEQLSLANSYREVGDAARASEHLDLARQRAAEETLDRPSDPEAAYTLGMVYEVMADYGKAREHYGRARTLLPSEAKYVSGYQRVDAYVNKAP